MELSAVITKEDYHAPGLSRIIAYIDFMEASEEDVKKLFDLPGVIEEGFKIEPYISNKGF